MNKNRRDKLRAVQSTLRLFISKLSDSKEVLESVKEEEQDSFDNLPECFQLSEKGEKMEEAIESIESALSDIESATESAEQAMSSIEDAKGG